MPWGQVPLLVRPLGWLTLQPLQVGTTRVVLRSHPPLSYVDMYQDTAVDKFCGRKLFCFRRLSEGQVSLFQ